MFSRKRSTISCSGVRATTLGANRRVTYRLTKRRAKNVMKNAEASPAWAQILVQKTGDKSTSRYQRMSM